MQDEDLEIEHLKSIGRVKNQPNLISLSWKILLKNQRPWGQTKVGKEQI